jgi:hypothetical protein
VLFTLITKNGQPEHMMVARQHMQLAAPTYHAQACQAITADLTCLLLYPSFALMVLQCPSSSLASMWAASWGC